MDKKCIKTTAMSNLSQVKSNNNSTSASSSSIPTQSPTQSPAQSTSQSLTAAPPRRVVNRIPLDFTKLKRNGLHRKLAEVLSKQSPCETKDVEAPSTSTATASSASAAALTTQQQQQKQRERQPAPAQTKKSTNLVAVDERSVDIKEKLRNKILSKSPQSPDTTTSNTAPLEVNGCSSERSFNIPLFKASTSPYSKQPFVLNSVNQLPKNRATCGRLRRQESSAEEAASIKRPKKPPPNAPGTSSPLIVLENKILAPNEKIDLRGLRLPKVQPPMELPRQDLRQVEKLETSTEKPREMADQFQSLSTSPPTPSRKFILNAKLLKMSSEQLTEFRKKADQQKEQTPNKTTIKSELREPLPKTLLNRTNIKTSLITPIVGTSPQSVSSGKSLLRGVGVPIPVASSTNSDKSFSVASHINGNKASSFPPTTAPHSYSPTKFYKALPSLKAPVVISSDTRNVSSINSTVVSVSVPVTSIAASDKSSPSLIAPVPVSSDITDNKLSSSSVPLPVISSTINYKPMSSLNPSVAVASDITAVLVPVPAPILSPVATDKSPPSIFSLPLAPESSSATNISLTPSVLVSNKSCSSSSPNDVTSPENSSPSSSSSRDSETPNNFSAVDFIAQLTSSNNFDTTNFMDLSAEELSLNAKFNYFYNAPVDNFVDMEDLHIGKILKIQEIDILHSTMNVDDNKSNVLCISPNAKLQSNNNMKVSFVESDSTNELTGESLKVTTLTTVSRNSENNIPLTKLPTVVVTAPQEESNEEPISKQQVNNVPLIQEEINEQLQQSTNEVPLTQDDSNEQLRKSTNEVPCTQEEINEELPESTNEVPLTHEEINEQLQNSTKEVPLTQQEIREQLQKSTNEMPLSQSDTECGKEEKQTSTNVPLKPNKIKKILKNPIKSSLKKEIKKKQNNQELCAEESISPIKTGLSTSLTTETTTENCQITSNELSNTKEKDISQLYYPSNVPKHIQNNNNNNNNNYEARISEQPSTVSLLDVLAQKQQPPQGEPQLPFRCTTPDVNKSTEVNPSSSLGIQNLVSHLAAENIVPQSKAVKPVETIKLPRKKLVKTRPVLNAKRVSKKDPSKTEAVQLRKRPLLTESKPNGTHRITTSSTSDDDGVMFHGFAEAPCSKRSKLNETDISDDATPDQDETEDEPQPVEMILSKEPKTENKIEAIPKYAEPAQKQKDENENLEAGEVQAKNKSILETDAKNEEPASVTNNLPVENTKIDGPQEGAELVTKVLQQPKRKRGRKPKATTPVENSMDKTENGVVEHQGEPPLTRLKVTRTRKISKPADEDTREDELPKEKTNLENLEALATDATSSSEDMPLVNLQCKRMPSSSTPKTIETSEQETPINSEIKTPAKRGRKKITRPVIETESNEAEPLSIIPTPKRRGRKPKVIELPLAKKLKMDESTEDLEDTVSGPDYWPQTKDFNLRLLLIRNRAQLESEEELREEGRGEGPVQCGLCLVRCEQSKWQKHLNEHYGVGWPIDKAPAVLFRGTLKTMMINYQKAGGSNRRLTCRLCARNFASGLGMLLHLENCGAKQERIECEFCKHSYTKLSFTQHYRSCHKRAQEPKEENLEVETETDKSTKETVYSNAGRAKRKSTLNAETKLQKIATQLQTQLADDLEDSEDFESESSGFDTDADKESSEEYDSEGADSNEDAAETEDDNESQASRIRHRRKRERREKRRSTLLKANEAIPLYGRIDDLKTVAEKRLNYFVKHNYAKNTLYPKLLHCYEELLPADAIKLLPSMEASSVRYGYGDDIAEDTNWMKLKPLEGFNKNSEYICYLGNPIKELAWVPLPSNVVTQYLLCSQRRKTLGFTRETKDNVEDALLLLLECSVPSSTERNDDDWTLQTRLHYAISVPQEPVHTFAFMPSGGYDESINRLGLLAVGSASRAVIYALPLKISEQESKEQRLNSVIVLQALITLSLDLDNPVQDACTKICWSEAAGHNLLVTGHSSGNVGFWDLADEQGLNYIEHNSERHLLPANVFYFGERNIRYLELHYDTNGARWLAVGGSVRKLWIYDISNWSRPLPIVGDTVPHLYLGCVNWPSLWESLACGSTELYRAHLPRLIMLNLSGILFTSGSVDVLLSGIRGVHFNSEQLMMVVVADNGDVVFLQTSEFNIEVMRAKRHADYRAVGITDACFLSDAEKPTSLTPDAFKRDYGLLFKPIKNVLNGQKTAYLDPDRSPNFELNNLMRLNCARWNWNAPARNWVAVGAEHGLLRIFNFKPDKHF